VPDPVEVERLITPRTRALVVINPNNPTGAVYPRQTLAALADIARQRHLVLCADEIYDEMLYDGAEFVPAASLDAFDDQAFALDLLERKHVLVAPGSSFNVPYRDHFRVTLLPDAEQMADVFGRIESLLDEYAAR